MVKVHVLAIVERLQTRIDLAAVFDSSASNLELQPRLGEMRCWMSCARAMLPLCVLLAGDVDQSEGVIEELFVGELVEGVSQKALATPGGYQDSGES